MLKHNKRRIYADGVSEHIIYDGEVNAIKHTKHLGKEVSYTYNLNGNLFTCRYDAEGLRHETEENGHLIKYIYRNRDVAVEESEDAGTTRYIRGNGRLIASDSEKARTYYHYVSNNIGSITYILNNTVNNMKKYRKKFYLQIMEEFGILVIV